MLVSRSRLALRGKGASSLFQEGSCCLIMGLFLVFGVVGCARRQVSVPPIRDIQETLDTQAKALQEAEMRERLSRAPRREGSYRIGTNDVVNITVFRSPEYNAITRVDGKGFIRFAPLGEIEAAGLSERELERDLEGRLRDKYVKEPHVTVFVSETHPREVYLFGAVGRPGVYPITGPMNLLDLLSRAGGVPSAGGNVAYVIRYDTATTFSKEGAPPESYSAENRMTIDMEGLLVRGESYWNVPIWPGDLVNVPVPDPGWVHVTGYGIERPGTYPLMTFLGLQGREVSPTGVQSLVPYPLTRSSKTLRQAIDEAGGLKWEANKTIQILRVGKDGKSDFIRVSYGAILKDTRNDIPLQSRDTVIVNRSTLKYVAVVTGRRFEQIFRFNVYAYYDLFYELGLTTRSSGVGGAGVP